MSTPTTSLETSSPSFDPADFAAKALARWQSLAAIIDHTLLKPEATRAQVEALCAEAARYRFACAMINPLWAPVATSALAGTGVPVGVVIGFPLGCSLASTLRQEAEALIKLGVRELDMVQPVGLLKGGDDATVAYVIQSAARVAHDGGALLKVILETSLLTDEEKQRASQIAIEAGADFIKTSTGFSKSGATPEDIALMRSVAGHRAGVKASGGIRTLADVRAMLAAGASRIGASASVAIVRELGAE